MQIRNVYHSIQNQKPSRMHSLEVLHLVHIPNYILDNHPHLQPNTQLTTRSFLTLQQVWKHISIQKPSLILTISVYQSNLSFSVFCSRLTFKQELVISFDQSDWPVRWLKVRLMTTHEDSHPVTTATAAKNKELNVPLLSGGAMSNLCTTSPYAQFWEMEIAYTPN